ncbi:hypothetical protein [Dokdonella sp.]|uniref:hypothetical protein n=1 Tax=Dokdonella sp. TaxID=2291710 RepID=UPI001B21E12D|nr:hypothetical protein [Dokdonella sp.]MBO9663402.1 hypothetical protein [Dokdonella sp.]
MDDSSLPPLTFAVIEARIQAMPEGPVSLLDTPRWAVVLYAIGVVAAFFGILPSLLMQFWEPRPWMAWMARGGLVVMCGTCALPALQSMWALLTHMLRFKKSMIEQMDHDRVAVGALARWLARYPKPVLVDHLRFAQHAQARLQAKLGFLAGSLDKLGILPAAAAVVIALQNWNGARSIPAWLAIAGIFLALLWLVGVLAADVRLRVHLFETLLGEAMRFQESEEAEARSSGATGYGFRCE